MSNAVANAGQHDSHAAHAHHPALQHHFDTMAQQKEAAVIGMWLFLLTEILFFGGLFVAYMIYRVWYFEAFAEASRRLSIFWGGLNTAVLIGSSLTMALAVRSAQLSDKKGLVINLIQTIACAFIFLIVKYFEYSAKFEHGLLPGQAYHGHEFIPGRPELFFTVYFTMTGLHGIHVVAGIGVLFWILKREIGRAHV